MRLTACALLAIAMNTASADIATIIPHPKEIRAIGKLAPLEGFRIIAHADERSQIGASEINERIASLGGKPLPVFTLKAPLPTGHAIIIAPCTASEIASELKRARIKVTPTDPGEQGYVIQPVESGANLRIFLVGSDSLGTLYAGVTLRQLIIKRGDNLFLQLATVRDYPDFKYRQIGTPFCEPLRLNWYEILKAERKGDIKRARELAREWVAFQKRYFDWMLRAKINFAWNSTNIRPGDAPDDTTVVRAALKEVHEYGLARGIESMAGDTTAIGTYPQDKDNPDFKGIVLHRAHRRYFCWSRLEYHRRRARRAAKWLADAGYTGYFLHSTDGGGWQNPELWNDRCSLCRRTYRDDRARADATVFGIYYREIKRLIPNIKFVAVVYPYSGRYLDQDYIYEQAAAMMGEGETARKVAQQTVNKLAKFFQRLNELLPRDIFVCVRECERRHMDLIRRAWKGRRFHIYYEYAYWKGWRPYFITTPLWTKTLFYPAYKDILYGSTSIIGWNEMTQLLGAECAWNVNRSGAREFSSWAWRAIGTKLKPPPERRTFALRACRFMFGDEIGHLIAPAYAENISHTFICFPEQVMRHIKIDDPVQTMREQAQATARALESLERAWELQRRTNVLKGDRYGYFLNMYLMTHAGHILAMHRTYIMAARRAIQRGDRVEAERQLNAARAFLKKAEGQWAKARARAPLKHLFAIPYRRTVPPGYLTWLNIAELRNEVEELWRRRDALIAAYTIPRWFEEICRRRELIAIPTHTPIVIDGRLSEDAWRKAPPIEHFVDYRILRLARFETRARLAYDANALYIAFECFDTNPKGITATLPQRDEYALCDSVEVFIAPRMHSKEFVHWVIDSKGTIFDARAVRMPDGVVKYSSRWNGTAKAKVIRGADRWTVEMAIPASDLGFAPKAGMVCRALLCRNIVHTKPKGEEECTAIVFLDGSSFHTVDKFARLRFASSDEPLPSPQVELVLRPLNFSHETMGDGVGTLISGGLRVDTDRNLHDFRITVECTDGIALLSKRELGKASLVRLMWRPKEPFSILFPAQLSGVVCKFIVTSREGMWTFTRRFGHPRRAPIPREKLFTNGVDGLALAMPAFFSSVNPKTIQLSEGTIEFWVRPRWDVITRYVGPRGALEHTFFNMGPIRPDYPHLSNRDSLTIYHSASGYLTCIISNSNYESRMVQASIRNWRKGEWHHVALQWKLDDGGRTAMALFIDGRLASNKCVGSKKHPNTKPLKVNQLPLPIQIGSMNTGYRIADADIDELRISSIRRYKGAFTVRRRFEPDAHTLALFHFDGTLSADVPSGVIATPGPAQ